jgi:hypothetical protein
MATANRIQYSSCLLFQNQPSRVCKTNLVVINFQVEVTQTVFSSCQKNLSEVRKLLKEASLEVQRQR